MAQSSGNPEGPRDQRHTGPRVHEIRKYPNRRYYDTTSRRHLALEEIRALVIDGNEIRVTDSRTGEDITAAVLTQIILTLVAPTLQVCPVSLLHRLVRANEGMVKDFVENYFERTLAYFLDAQRQWEDQLSKGFKIPTVPRWPVDWSQFGTPPNPFVRPEGESSGAPEPEPSEPPPAEAEPREAPDLGQRLQELQAEIRNLQEALGQSGSPPPSPPEGASDE